MSRRPKTSNKPPLLPILPPSMPGRAGMSVGLADDGCIVVRIQREDRAYLQAQMGLADFCLLVDELAAFRDRQLAKVPGRGPE